MEIRRRLSLIERLDRLAKSWSSQTLHSGQHFLNYAQLTQLANIADCLKYGRTYAGFNSSWSIHDMVSPSNLAQIYALLRELACSELSRKSLTQTTIQPEL